MEWRTMSGECGCRNTNNNKTNLRDLIAATGQAILLQLDSNHWFYGPSVIAIWRMTLKNTKGPLPYYVELCASFKSHRWIQTGVTVRKRTNLGQNRRFFVPFDLEIWRMTLKNNMAPLLCYFKLCASFRSHLWIRIGLMVQKSSNWGRICFDLCAFDSWPWPFARISLLSMAISPENFVMIRWKENIEKMWQTDGRTDRRKRLFIYRAAWSQLICFF